MTPSSRKIALLIAFVITTSVQVVTATPEFYSNLLRRGISEFNAGRYASAASLLRTAAFGLLDAVDQFDTAQAYVAVASQRLGRDDDARHATRRILMAERVQRRFAALPLPPELRTEFEAVAHRYLTGGEHAALFDARAEVPPRQVGTAVRRRQAGPVPTQAPEPKSPPQTTPTVIAEQPAPVVVPQPPTAEPVPEPAPAEPPAKSTPQPASTPDVPTAVTEDPEPHNLVEETPAPVPPAAQTPKTIVEPPVVAAEPAPPQPVAVEAVPPTVVETQTAPNPTVTVPPVVPPEPAVTEPAATERPAQEPPQPVARAEALPTQSTPPVPEPEVTAPEPVAEPAAPVASAEVPAPTGSTTPPSAEAVREAQREFERKVAEVERSETKPAPRTAATRDVARMLGEAAAALDHDDVFGAREKLRDAFAVTNLRRDDILTIAEEAYRARDFALSVEAFTRAGALGRGEEAFGYYLAVALYETGKYGEAKAALAAALPHIEVTDDVARYRAKIEGALE